MKKTFTLALALIISCSLGFSQRISTINVVDSRSNLPITVLSQGAASNPGSNPGVWHLIFPENADLSQVELDFAGLTVTDKYPAPTNLTQNAMVEIMDNTEKVATYEIVPYILKLSENLQFESDFETWNSTTKGWAPAGITLNSGNIRFGMLKSSAAFGIDYTPEKINLQACYISTISDLKGALFNVEESQDGATWSLVHSFSDDTTPLKSNKEESEIYSFDLKSESRFFRTTLITKPTNGSTTANVDVKAINITELTTSRIDGNQTENIVVFPIPAKEYVMISGAKRVAKVVLHNCSGQIVSQEELKTNQFHIGSLAAGFYQARIIFDDNTQIVKTIVKE